MASLPCRSDNLRPGSAAKSDATFFAVHTSPSSGEASGCSAIPCTTIAKWNSFAFGCIASLRGSFKGDTQVDFPLLLAGPILRRVEAQLVSVWMALSVRATLRLVVWEGRVASGAANAMLESSSTPTLRVGDKLHLAQVTIEIPATAGKTLQANTLYSYDVEITTADGATHTLGSLGLLRGTTAEPRRVPLGFEEGVLPSFAPPPSRLDDLNLLYGSCRRPGHPHPDALAMVDHLIFGEDRYRDPRARPHQLFLGGDQIYADDVTQLHMLVIMDLAAHLIGARPDGTGLAPVEHVRLDRILRLARPVDPAKPEEAYETEPEDDTRADPDLPVDRARFPEGRRLSTTIRDAQLTSSDGDSHVISLGEFAALYLTVWSNALWGEEVIGARFAADPARPGDNRVFRWTENLPETGRIVMPEVEFPRRIAGHFYVAPEEPRKTLSEKEQAEKDEERRKAGLRAFRILQAFRNTLPEVQRVLANVPTYMILDDHDVTDDLFLNPMWRDRVLTTQLGQAILRNAMVAYALFQDWGNDPLEYRRAGSAKQELLSLVPRLFPEGEPKGPVQAVCERVAHLLGHDLRNTPTADGRYAPIRPPLLWHFMVDGPTHRVIALDNRTRRSYASRLGPPGNVSIEAMLDQIPLPPLPAGREILIVIAPLQVIGPPVLDDIVAPGSYRAFDLGGASKTSLLSASSSSGLRQMTGTNPDAIEAWAFDVATFEHLLERLEPYGRVVLLSGDVHYSSGTVMSYWRGQAQRPARFAQFTSSGFKNVMPTRVTFVDRSIGFAQQMVRADLGAERIGWDAPQEEIVLLPAGTSEADLVPVMRARLQAVPVTVPTWGWPDLNDPAAPFDPSLASRLNPAVPPDWRWRVKPLRDRRSEAARPTAIRVREFEDAEAVERDLLDPARVAEGYQAVAARHQHALGRLRNARQMLFRANVGRVRFVSHTDGRRDAVHEVFTTFADPDDPAVLDPIPEPFLVQVAHLGPEDEDPPERLRKKAIEIPPAGSA
jgi:hypothetical protein